VAVSASHLFSVEPAEQIRYRAEKAHTGNMIFEGENPPNGAILDFWTAGDGSADISILNSTGQQVAGLEHGATRGMNRVVWDLRHARIGGDAVAQAGGGGRGGRGGGAGPRVVPGRYTARLTSGGLTSEQTFEVREDPRLEFDSSERAEWTAAQLDVWERMGEAQALSRAVGRWAAMLDANTDALNVDPGLETELRDMARQMQELSSRISGLYRSMDGWVGPLAADQASQRGFLTDALTQLSADWTALAARLPA
jgi:hypothetical protein